VIGSVLRVRERMYVSWPGEISQRMRKRKALLSVVDRVLLAAGLALLGVWLIATIYGQAASAAALRAFDAREPTSMATGTATTLDRQSARRDKQPDEGTAAIAVLRLVKLNVRIPVFKGTTRLVLNQGAGWIAGTARPGDIGNVGIAGHRASFFRPLRLLESGDLIELSTPARTLTYTVDEREIVSPRDTRVLRPRGAPSLTLVTCYPFYFVGSAPERFVLHATVTSQSKVAAFSEAAAALNQ